MILLAQQNGSGPIVSLSMGPGSAPAPLAAAPSSSELLPTDGIMFSRAGTLNLIYWSDFLGTASTLSSLEQSDALLVRRSGQLFSVGPGELVAAGLAETPSPAPGVISPTGFFVTPEGDLKMSPIASARTFTFANIGAVAVAGRII